jgi:hypothetical protein
MQCFAHPNESAVGLCKSCGKGVCRSCAIQLDRGLACSEQCKPFTEALSRLQLTSIRNIGLMSVQRFIQPFMAVIFLVAGFYNLARYRPDPSTWFLLAFGAILGVMSVISWVRQGRSQ